MTNESEIVRLTRQTNRIFVRLLETKLLLIFLIFRKEGSFHTEKCLGTIIFHFFREFLPHSMEAQLYM